MPVHLVRQINCGYFPIMMVKELQLLYHNRKRDFSTYTYFSKVGVVTTTYFGKVGAIIICFCHSFNIYLPTKIVNFDHCSSKLLLFCPMGQKHIIIKYKQVENALVFYKYLVYLFSHFSEGV